MVCITRKTLTSSNLAGQKTNTMSEKKSKFQAVINSSNFWTDAITIVLGAGFGVAGYFHVLPDIAAAQTIGADAQEAVAAVKTGSITLIFTALLKIYNTISHILKND